VNNLFRDYIIVRFLKLTRTSRLLVDHLRSFKQWIFYGVALIVIGCRYAGDLGSNAALLLTIYDLVCASIETMFIPLFTSTILPGFPTDITELCTTATTIIMLVSRNQ
jgi:hypothetical protein